MAAIFKYNICVLILPLFSSATIMKVYPLKPSTYLAPSGKIHKLTCWVAAILDYKMATTKIASQSIHFHTAKNVGIATKIEFLYCLACDILSKQLLEVSILRSKMAAQNVFPFKWKHWSLVSERSQFSKKCIWLQLSTKFERKYIATLTTNRGRTLIDFRCLVVRYYRRKSFDTELCSSHVEYLNIAESCYIRRLNAYCYKCAGLSL